ncbi:hypothetical protein LSM04_000460 [Trypanosoma melophagium]|uniref:uncharacterized protein n=1 Tax=Trypanosoma melophagium TaxID=715481 RepID=UPI00351A22CE|nr:hypothetical protein LSM04_000460 [Trypanosoma melophagium]
MQEVFSPWKDESNYHCDSDNQDSFSVFVANGKEESVSVGRRTPGRRSEVAILMDKLVSEQQKVQGLEEQLTLLKNELEEARFASQSIFCDGVLDPSQSINPIQKNVKNSISQDAPWNDSISHSSSAVPLVPPIWISGESELLKSVSLPELISKRNAFLSSLHTLSDAIARKRLISLGRGGVMNSVSRENEAIIQASMHRLFGEAFYINSVADIKELASITEEVNGREIETFDFSIQTIKSLNEAEEVLDSYENAQEFILHPASRFTSEWRHHYAWSMRRLLVAFAVISRRSLLLETRRTELERITRQELVHTILLRALQGRDVVPPSVHCLSPEAMTATKTTREAEPEAKFDLNGESYSKRTLQSLASPTKHRGRNSTSSRGDIFLSSVHAATPRSARNARNRWNPPRSNSTATMRRDESSRVTRPPRESLISTNTQRRRTAASLGLASIYTGPPSRTYLQRPSHILPSTRENSHSASSIHLMSPISRARREAMETPMIGLPVQSSMSPRAYSATRNSQTPRRRLHVDCFRN